MLDKKVIETIMEKDRLYYHCCLDGGIYMNKEMTIKVIQLEDNGNGMFFVPEMLQDYLITSGYCEKCYNKEMDKLDRDYKILASDKRRRRIRE